MIWEKIYLRLSLFVLFLPIIFSTLDFISVFGPETFNSVQAYSGLKPFSALIYLFYTISFCFIAYLSFIFFYNSLQKNISFNKTLNQRSINILLNIFSFIFFVFSIFSIYRIYNIGFITFLLSAREGIISIGPIIYFTIIMWPMVLANKIYENRFSVFNIISLLIIIFLNLITGFRLILVWGLFMIMIYNWQFIINYSKIRLGIILGIVVFASLIYEGIRINLAGFSSSDLGFFTLINSLNRTYPLQYLDLILGSNLSLHFFDILFFWINPILVFLNSLGFPIDQSINLNFYLDEVSTPLFSDFLAFRGTPNYEATGISISIISFSFLFSSFIGFLIFAVFYGIFLAMGAILIKSESFTIKTLGILLLAGCLFCNESVVVASQLLVFSLIFLVTFIFFTLFLGIFLTKKNARSFNRENTKIISES